MSANSSVRPLRPSNGVNTGQPGADWPSPSRSFPCLSTCLPHGPRERCARLRRCRRGARANRSGRCFNRDSSENRSTQTLCPRSSLKATHGANLESLERVQNSEFDRLASFQITTLDRLRNSPLDAVNRDQTFESAGFDFGPSDRTIGSGSGRSIKPQAADRLHHG